MARGRHELKRAQQAGEAIAPALYAKRCHDGGGKRTKGQRQRSGDGAAEKQSAEADAKLCAKKRRIAA